MSTTRELKSLEKDFEEIYGLTMPQEATSVGLRKFDRRLSDPSPVSMKQLRKSMDALEARLKKLKSGLKDKNAKFEVGNLIARTRSLRKFSETSLRTPALYLLNLLFACHDVMVRDFIPDQVECVTSRLRQTGKYFENARLNVKGISKRQIDVAIGLAPVTVQFFEKSVPEWAKGKGSPRELLKLSRQTAENVRKYVAFLKELRARAPKDAHFTEEEYEEILRDTFGIEICAFELEEIGVEQMRKWEKELKRIASKISPGKGWEKVMEELREDCPKSEGELMESYAKLTEDFRKAAKELNIVSLPEGERAVIRPMPEFYREIAPFAAYVWDDLVGSRPTGSFFVTPSVKGVKPEEHFKEHNYPSQKMTVIHECYPGHHVNASNMALYAPRIRQLLTYAGYGLMEGWGLYTEELMTRAMKLDAKAQLEMARGCLWRAVRVIVDVRLHLGRYTFEEAVDFTAKKLKMSKDSALREVWFHLIYPGYKPCYMVGKLMIEKVKEWARKNWKGYSDKKFHDLVVRAGDVTLLELYELVRNFKTAYLD